MQFYRALGDSPESCKHNDTDGADHKHDVEPQMALQLQIRGIL